jgi:PEP-CTERM motif
VNPTFPLVTIFASKDQIDSGGIPNGTKVTDTQSIGVLTVNGLSTANETMQVSYSPVTAVTTSSAVTIPTGSLLLKYDQTFFENTGTGVPEPATYGLLGGGLLLLGAMRRA